MSLSRPLTLALLTSLFLAPLLFSPQLSQPALAAGPANSAPAGGVGQESLANLLRYYRIRLIIDHSGSMYRPIGNSDKLRWIWVKEEVERFCSAVQRVAGSATDIYLFNEQVDVSLNQSAAQVHWLLDKTVTTGSTNLPEALTKATAAAEKPLLLVLITDGQSVSSKDNAKILSSTLSGTTTLRGSRIVFLQAGYSTEGSNFIASLNDELVDRGMGRVAYVVLFEEASQRGILGSIEPLLRRPGYGAVR